MHVHGPSCRQSGRGAWECRFTMPRALSFATMFWGLSQAAGALVEAEPLQHVDLPEPSEADPVPPPTRDVVVLEVARPPVRTDAAVMQATQALLPAPPAQPPSLQLPLTSVPLTPPDDAPHAAAPAAAAHAEQPSPGTAARPGAASAPNTAPPAPGTLLRNMLDEIGMLLAANRPLPQEYEEWLQRLRRRNGYVSEFNIILAAVLRCNTNVNVLATEEQGKAVAMYLAKYICKDKVQLAAALATVRAAFEHVQRFPSTHEDDAGTPQRAFKQWMQRIINTINGVAEVPSTMAAYLLLGGTTILCSHKFEYAHVTAAVDYCTAQRAAARARSVARGDVVPSDDSDSEEAEACAAAGGAATESAAAREAGCDHDDSSESGSIVDGGDAGGDAAAQAVVEDNDDAFFDGLGLCSTADLFAGAAPALDVNAAAAADTAVDAADGAAGGAGGEVAVHGNDDDGDDFWAQFVDLPPPELFADVAAGAPAAAAAAAAVAAQPAGTAPAAAAAAAVATGAPSDDADNAHDGDLEDMRGEGRGAPARGARAAAASRGRRVFRLLDDTLLAVSTEEMYHHRGAGLRRLNLYSYLQLISVTVRRAEDVLHPSATDACHPVASGMEVDEEA
ncbi:MAG: hypothetical protein EOO41_02540, partial [Methanobacteriota archaeon]